MTRASRLRRALMAFGPSAATVFCGLALSAPARAAIPPSVDAMIREAARSGDQATVDAVVKVAKATNPDDAEAIEALGSTLLAQAQEKAEAERQAKLKSQGFFQGWSGQGQAGAGLTSGNTSETSIVVGLGLERKGLKTRHKFSALVDYLHSNGVTTRQKYALDYAFNYTVTDGLYFVGTLGWERDKFAGYARRFTESVGFGYRALDTDSMKLDLEGGPAFRQTKFIDGGSQSEFGARGSLDYRWAINDGLLFSQKASVLSAADNTTLTSTTALSAKINGKLSTRLSFNVQKETDPPAGRKSTDTSTRATLVYSF